MTSRGPTFGRVDGYTPSALAESVGLRVQTFATAQDFLQAQRPDVPGCLVLDVRLPGLINPRTRLTTSPARFTSWTIRSSPSRAWARSGC